MTSTLAAAAANATTRKIEHVSESGIGCWISWNSTGIPNSTGIRGIQWLGEADFQTSNGKGVKVRTFRTGRWLWKVGAGRGLTTPQLNEAITNICLFY
jgi:hypothetical protein